MSLKLNSSGGGSVTIQEPTTASNFTLSLPAATGTVQVSGAAISGTTGSFSSDLSFNSGYGSAAVAYGCRAWVNFNGTGTVAIRASGNVSSITDNGTGDYTVNFTTALVDANYSMVVGGGNGRGAGTGVVFGGFWQTSPTTTSARFATYQQTPVIYDPVDVCVAVFR